MTLPELYDALCVLWGVDEIKDEKALLVAEVVLEVIGHSAEGAGEKIYIQYPRE